MTFTSSHSAALVVMRMRPGTGMAALDKDGDGKISEEELNAKKFAEEKAAAAKKKNSRRRSNNKVIDRRGAFTSCNLGLVINTLM